MLRAWRKVDQDAVCAFPTQPTVTLDFSRHLLEVPPADLKLISMPSTGFRFFRQPQWMVPPRGEVCLHAAVVPDRHSTAGGDRHDVCCRHFAGTWARLRGGGLHR